MVKAAAPVLLSFVLAALVATTAADCALPVCVGDSVAEQYRGTWKLAGGPKDRERCPVALKLGHNSTALFGAQQVEVHSAYTCDYAGMDVLVSLFSLDDGCENDVIRLVQQKDHSTRLCLQCEVCPPLQTECGNGNYFALNNCCYNKAQ
eukprot:TRINITY_DN2911_c0_g1_i1.p2 TRINITY_DN2911_c0_g1~~TRINITY_DN2911_c0_g1_i1.p2  ORF type:complete len:149 (-),score=49.64 TRINITY_DN2911_c0_g1_i1:89-535(-)